MDAAVDFSEILDQVVCPACRGRLVAAEGVSLRCTECGRSYPIVDGIPILLVERAVVAPR